MLQEAAKDKAENYADGLKLKDLKTQLMNHITTTAEDFPSHKTTYNGLVVLMNKYKQYKAEAKPHIKVSRKRSSEAV